MGAKTAYIMPGSPWGNGYCESFNSKLRDEPRNGEIFYMLKEAKIIIENWRRHYNTVRPHSSLGYKPPSPEAAVWPRQNGPASTPAVASRPSIPNGSPYGAGQNRNVYRQSEEEGADPEIVAMTLFLTTRGQVNA